MRKLAVCGSLVFWLTTAPAFLSHVAAIEPEVAVLAFDSLSVETFHHPQAEDALPPWILGIEQEGGRFLDQPHCWYVEESQPVGHGRLSILLDREILQEDLALSILFEGDDQSDVAVQLFDANDKVVVLDLFGNLVEVGEDARTDTFILPLLKYPGATKITIRRVSGEIKVYGAVLYPVVLEAEADQQTLQELAKLLGDPLNPEKPVADGLKNISKHGDLSSPSPRESEPLPRDIARSVSGQVEDNLKGTPIGLSQGEDSPPPVIGYLETRDRIIAINAGSEASYTIRSKDGKLLADRVGLAGLLGKYPELYQLLQGAVARPNRVIDASLSYR